MKKLLFCLLLTSLFSFNAHAQLKSKLPNHSNVIYLTGISKTQLKDSLIRNGFTTVDHDTSSFLTLPRQYKILEHGNLVIQVKQTDVGLKITGKYSLIANETMFSPFGNRWRQAEQTRMESIQKEAFLILINLAQKMPGGISFAKEKLEPLEVKEITPLYKPSK